MRFSCLLEPQEGVLYPKSIDLAKECEKSGFHALLLSDHFFLDSSSANKACLETWTLLTALATKTEFLRLGTLVSCQSYRPPSLLAKMAATFDVISNGRLQFGIGAGWKEIEYEAYGYVFPNPLTRAQQLAEAIQIIKKMWTEDTATFEGRHYYIKDAICFPKPVQKLPVIWVGAQGEKLMFRVVAEHADGINFGFALNPSNYKKKLDILEERCELIERPFSSLRKSVINYVFSKKQEKRTDAYIRERARQRYMTFDKYRQRMEGAIWGDSDAIIQILTNYADLGVEEFVALFPYVSDLAAIKDFSNNVLPSFQ